MSSLRAAVLAAFFVLAHARAAAADVEVFKLDVPDKPKLTLSLYGWIQPRFTVQEHDERKEIDLKPNPAFTLLRARLGTIATLSKWATAQVELDVSKDFVVPIDAFVNLSPITEKVATLNLQLGQFRVPFSRQNLLASRTFQFPDVAYFVTKKFLVDRDLGAMLWSELFEGRAKLSVGVFNGNEPGAGQTLNSDRYFLFAARVEGHPLGRAPRFEGDLRPLEEQKKFLVTVGASGMRNRFEDKHVVRSYFGADLAAYWYGASLYGEFYYHVDDPIQTTGPNAGALVKQVGANGQAGYFPPLPWVREHIEAVARVEFIDPDTAVKKPVNDSGARELDGANPTWGYVGLVFGGNLYWDRGHNLKLQATYELRNETKLCLEGQTGNKCTGAIANNLFVAQVTAGF